MNCTLLQHLSYKSTSIMKRIVSIRSKTSAHSLKEVTLPFSRVLCMVFHQEVTRMSHDNSCSARVGLGLSVNCRVASGLVRLSNGEG